MMRSILIVAAAFIFGILYAGCGSSSGGGGGAPAADLHNLRVSVVDDPDPTAGDYIEALLTRKDGTAVDPGKGPLDLQYTLTLIGGEVQTRTISVATPAFHPSIGLGRNNANVEIQVSDLDLVEVTVLDGGNVVKANVNLNHTVNSTGVKDISLP